MKEHDFQNQIRLELSKLGYITFRTNVGKVKLHDGRWFDTGLPVGFSDLIALKNGKTYFIELKQGKRMATKEQINFIEQMKRNGFSAGIAYNMNDVLNILKVDNN
jgi:hypothetical protein